MNCQACNRKTLCSTSKICYNCATELHWRRFYAKTPLLGALTEEERTNWLPEKRRQNAPHS